MTVRIYGLGCKSTKQATQWFKKNNIPFIMRNIIKDPLTVTELKEFLRMTIDGTDDILAKKSKKYKELDIDFDELPLPELLELFHQYPRLLKSPIIFDEKRLQAGYNEEEIRQFLPREVRQSQWLKQKMTKLNIAELL
jgi:regulatory protein spx